MLTVTLLACTSGQPAPGTDSRAPIPAPSTPTTPAASSTTPVGTPASTIPPTSSSTSSSSTPVEVLSVTDGDTLRVLVNGVNEPVRLIGINAPEGGECLAAEAAVRLGELVSSGPIILRRDVSERDRFDRLLRYVFAGETFVNETLVGQGLALAVTYEPDVAETARLEAAQEEARQAGMGMWGRDACGAPATGVIEIGHIRYDAAGDDNDNLNDEWVEFTNPGESALDLTGWSVKDESATHRYHFPDGFVIEPGATVRLHTGCGDDDASSLFWCNQGSAVWNNSGDTVFVVDPNGNVVVAESYPGR